MFEASNFFPNAARINISCVVDNHPRFRMQAWNWLLSLKALKTKCKIFVHYVSGALSDNSKAEFRALNATLVEIASFAAGAGGYCNKIRQLENPELLDADFVILSDCDIAFLSDPALLAVPGFFRAKTVDNPFPPKEIWSEIFAITGLEDKLKTVAVEMYPGIETFATNFNGGIYVMPAKIASTLLPLWRKHAEFCLTQHDLLGGHLHHSDQVGMGLALVEGGISILPLPAGANLPTPLPKEMLSLLTTQEVSGLHYHQHVDQQGLPCKVGIEWIDTEIVRLREILTTQRRDSFASHIPFEFC